MTSKHVSHVRKLYKLVLRLHRSLPADLRFLGDSYAKEEFRLHKNCKPEEAQIFLNEWQNYAAVMSRQVAPVKPGSSHVLDEKVQAVVEGEQKQKSVCEEGGIVGEGNHDDGGEVPDDGTGSRNGAEIKEMTKKEKKEELSPAPVPLTPPAVRRQSTRAPVPATPSQALVTVHRSLRPTPRFGFHLPQDMVIRFSNEQIHRFFELGEAAGDQSNFGRFSVRSVYYSPARAQHGQRPIAPPAMRGAAARGAAARGAAARGATAPGAAARVPAIRAQAEPTEPADRNDAGNPNEQNAGIVVKKEH